MTSTTITTYSYDARDRLTNVAAPGNTLAYVYDADGHRTRETANGIITNFVWDELSTYGDVILETDSNHVTLTRYVRDNARMLAQTRSASTQYYLLDGQNSTRALTNTSGVITDSYSYDAFGQLLDNQGSSTNRYLYAGQQFDSTTKLYSLRARIYAPASGRFVSRDKFSLNLQSPSEYNRYVYVANNPVRFYDPTGFTSTDYGGLLTSLVTPRNALYALTLHVGIACITPIWLHLYPITLIFRGPVEEREVFHGHLIQSHLFKRHLHGGRELNNFQAHRQKDLGVL